MSAPSGSGSTASPWAATNWPSRAQHNLADVSTAVLASHVDDGDGRCRGCHRVFGRVMTWPCTFVRLGDLAEKIAKGDLGER